MTGVADATPAVVMVKVAVVAPAATVTLAGTVAAVLLSESWTTMPPAGAAEVRVTVPVALLPPTTLVGFTETADRFVGMIVRVAVAVPL